VERGTYTTYHKTRLPKRKRTIRLKGSFEDKGKYIRCWNCGFIVDTDRDLGDPERSGCYQTDATVYAQTLGMGGSNVESTLDGLDMIGVLIQNDNTGSPITSYYTPRLPEVSKGCPLCGCSNLI
jgi:hypothetical protein